MINTDKIYRNIWILDSRDYWLDSANSSDPYRDLVLTFDFGLKREIERIGGQVFYADHLCEQSEMQKNNFLAAEFFKKWHYDRCGNDIFTAQGIPFGFAFRIEIWSEYLFYVRLRACLEKLKGLQYETIYVGEERGFIGDILQEMGMPFIAVNLSPAPKDTAYYFDMHEYMHDALHGRTIRDVARNLLIKILSNTSFYIDRIFRWQRNRKTVYIQIYHPTKKIVTYLQSDPGVRVVTSSLSASKGLKKYFVQRLIPVRGRLSKFEKEARSLLNDFSNNRCASLCLFDGTDITTGAYNILEKQIQPRVSEALRILNSAISYIEKEPVHLEIMIANLGFVQTIVDCVLKRKQVPSYLIINGLLGGSFCDESKYATFINGYSESIKRLYFNSADNVVCLGDPRMDDYIMKARPAPINRVMPTVSIGASGFGCLDLNSYVAIEFDFMFDVLTVFQELQDEGSAFNLIIKVRPNGSLKQYIAFAKEYFPRLDIEIVREIPISQVLYKTDLYISIYSQTLFEASCLGVPVVYYKKDKEILDPPFDQRSELVTVDSIAGLKQAFFDFKSSHDRFQKFLEKSVMEKYIGPLDGKNLERNLSFIYGLLEQRNSRIDH